MKVIRTLVAALFLIGYATGAGAKKAEPAPAASPVNVDNIELTAKDSSKKKKYIISLRLVKYFMKQMKTKYKDLAEAAKKSKKLQYELDEILEISVTAKSYKMGKEAMDMRLKQLDDAREGIIG